MKTTPGELDQIWRDINGAWHYSEHHVLPVLGTVAAATAIVVFVQGSLLLRRRPEAGISWAWALPGDDAGFDRNAWSGDLVVPPSERVRLRIVWQNIGDGTSDLSVWNFCISPLFEVENRETTKGLSNRVVGPCQLASGRERWLADLVLISFIDVRVPEDEGTFPVYFEIQDRGLNAIGHRWVPSLVERIHNGAAATRWPRRVPRVIRMQPSSLEARRGIRSDVRWIVVEPGKTVKTRSHSTCE